PRVKLIDYTGGSTFGTYLELLPGKIVFTEKAGVNPVIIDSADDVEKVAANLAFSVSLYSGQMCTAPQNIFIANAGIKTPAGTVSFEAFAEKLAAQITGLVDNPRAGPFVLGAIQNNETCERIAAAEKLPGKVWLKSRTFVNPEFPDARVATPVVVEMDAAKRDLFSEERFGPIVLLIRTADTDESIALARDLAVHHGAISCGAYVTDPEVK